MPPTLLVLLAIASVQFGAALAKGLFDEIGVGGSVFLRVLFAAIVLMAVWRPSPRGRSRNDLVLVALFGVVLACMNLSFYSSLDRIPLGAAVTFEFVGPLGVAVAGSRRPLDLLWVGLAAAGILLLSDLGQGGLDAAVAVLSSAIPYALEMEALRRLPTGVFGVLMSLEPGMAALAGYVLLGEGLAAREIIAILLVVAASAGASRGAAVAPRDA